MAAALFIVSVLLVAYACAGYPVLVYVLGRFREKRVRSAEITPSVSIIIAAHNEEVAIAEKLERTLSLDYPSDKLEIIVASDSSTDRTDEIVRGFSDRGVILHRQDQRLGKTIAQNGGVDRSRGEILVFTDATTDYPPEMLRKLVRSFADPEVGCVSSNVVYVDRRTSAIGSGCQSYWSYEKTIQRSESCLGSMIGVTGCLYAVRRSSYSPLKQNMCSDFVIASETKLKGLRTVFEPEAISIEQTNHKGRSEFRMRVRIMEQTMTSLRNYREVLSIRRHGLFAFQMLSHKVLRYAVPAFLMIAFLSNLFIATDSPFFLFTLAAQIIFYSAAIAGWLLTRSGARLGTIGIPYYFVLSNLATVIAFMKFVRGETHLVWEPLREANASEEGARATGAAGNV